MVQKGLNKRRERVFKLLTSGPRKVGCYYALSTKDAAEKLGITIGTLNGDTRALRPRLDVWKAKEKKRTEVKKAVVEETDDLSILNFTNMINYHREELQQILDGAPITKVFDSHDAKLLRRSGIIVNKSVPWVVESLMERLIPA